MACPNGSGTKPDVDGLTEIDIRYTDYGAYGTGDLTEEGFTRNESGGWSVDLPTYFAPDRISEYGVAIRDIASNFCRSEPPASFPDLPPTVSALVAIRARQKWNELCRCLPPPQSSGCAHWNGKGQCLGKPYSVGLSVRFFDSNNPSFGITQNVAPYCYPPLSNNNLFAPVSAPYVYHKATGGTQIRVNCKDINGTDTYQIFGDSGYDSATILSSSIVMCVGGEDNCCPPIEEPPPPPPPPPIDNRIIIVLDGDEPPGGDDDPDPIRIPFNLPYPVPDMILVLPPNCSDCPPGAAGQDGQDGRDGVDGQDGRDGVDGQDGRDGVDGQDGRDGVDGTNGGDGRSIDVRAILPLAPDQSPYVVVVSETPELKVIDLALPLGDAMRQLEEINGGSTSTGLRVASDRKVWGFRVTATTVPLWVNRRPVRGSSPATLELGGAALIRGSSRASQIKIDSADFVYIASGEEPFTGAEIWCEPGVVLTFKLLVEKEDG